MVSTNLSDLQSIGERYPFRTGFIFLLLSLPLFVGCSDDDCPPCSTPTDDRISFEVNFLEYSDNNYFIADVYHHQLHDDLP